MKFAQGLLLGILTILMSIADVKTVRAYEASTNPPIHSRDKSILTIAQLTESRYPLYGLFQLQYSIGGIVYESVLLMNGYVGAMRTNFFDITTGKTVAVDQIMSLKSSYAGLVLLGYNPVYAGTEIPHPTYSADNFLFQVGTDGRLNAATCDDSGQCSDVRLEIVQLK